MYFAWVIGMSVFVNFLLLLCADRLTGQRTALVRTAAAAIFGGVYAGCCLIPGFYFLGNFIWRVVHFGFISVIAYGLSVSTFHRGLVFALLSLALGGAMVAIGKGGAVGAIAVAGMLLILSYCGLDGRINGRSCVPVELSLGGNSLRLTALQDTGNTLRDPITGRPVLVVSADAAQKLGLYIRVTGNTDLSPQVTAVRQDIPAGTQVTQGTTVVLEFTDTKVTD